MNKTSRSIKDSIGGAAFDFVKQGFEEPKKTPAASQTTKAVEVESPKPANEKKLAVVSAEEKPKTEKPKSSPKKKAAPVAEENNHLVPLSTRMKAGLVAEIKREGLRRQLAEDPVCTVQAILEQAAEDWLKRNSTA